MSSPVRIPADVDMADRVIGSLTARQVTILGLTALGLYGAWDATRSLVTPSLFLAVAVPIAVTAVVLALGRRDGVSMDRLFLAAIRHRLAPHTRTAHPDSGEAPAWLDARRRPDDEPAARGRRGDLRLPASAVTPARAGTDLGVVDLGGDGLAAVAVASTVNFALRTPAEQQALVATFGRYLHSLSAPVQLLVRAEPLDLTGQVEDLRARAHALPHPALRAAAREHAAYLARLAKHGMLLRRQVLLVLREPVGPAGPMDGLGGPSPLSAVRAGVAGLLGSNRRMTGSPTGGGVRRAAEARLVRRVGEAVELLAPAGITLTPLDAARTTAVLAAACNPDPLLPATSLRGGSGDVVRAAPGANYWEGDDPGDDPVDEPARDPDDVDGWLNPLGSDDTGTHDAEHTDTMLDDECNGEEGDDGDWDDRAEDRWQVPDVGRGTRTAGRGPDHRGRDRGAERVRGGRR